MKKNFVAIPIAICALVIIVIYIHSKLTTPSLDFWLGNYTYNEVFPNRSNKPPNASVPTIDHKIRIFKDANEMYAEIISQGYQTNTHIFAKVVGDNSNVDFIFDKYSEDNRFESYYKGDLLFSFKLIGSQLYTVWDQMINDTAINNNQLTGIYYTKDN
jgi:hypothetical protein